MKDKFRSILLISAIYLITSTQIAKSDLILPLKKPLISAIEMEKSNLSNYIVPPIKPSIMTKDNEVIETKTNIRKIVDGILLPKNKPLVVKKDRAIVKKKSK